MPCSKIQASVPEQGTCDGLECFLGGNLALGWSGKDRRCTPYQFSSCSPAWFCTHITQTPLPADFPLDAPHSRPGLERGQQERGEGTSLSCSWSPFLSAQPVVGLVSGSSFGQPSCRARWRRNSPGDWSSLLVPVTPASSLLFPQPWCAGSHFLGLFSRGFSKNFFSVLYNQTFRLAFLN